MPTGFANMEWLYEHDMEGSQIRMEFSLTNS